MKNVSLIAGVIEKRKHTNIFTFFLNM